MILMPVSVHNPAIERSGRRADVTPSVIIAGSRRNIDGFLMTPQATIVDNKVHAFDDGAVTNSIQGNNYCHKYHSYWGSGNRSSA